MKNSIIVIFLLTVITGFSQIRLDYPVIELEPAELVATYSLKYRLDSTNPHFIRQEDMLLILGDNFSKFLSFPYYYYDSAMRKTSTMHQFRQVMSDPDKPPVRIRYQIIKDHSRNELCFIEHVIPATLLYKEELNTFNWTLTQETDSMNKFLVQKAECEYSGRQWTAWFSPEIPFNDGPYKFGGLPGLILKIQDQNEDYVFELTSLEKPAYKMMIDYREKEFVETTKKGFFKAEDAFREDIISRAREAGLPSKTQQTAARNMAAKNNPIELKRK